MEPGERERVTMSVPAVTCDGPVENSIIFITLHGERGGGGAREGVREGEKS